jgi:hypothetical protein
MSFVVAMLAVTATCVPSDQPKLTKLETTTAFFTAFNGHDQAAMGGFIKPGAMIVMGSGDSAALAELLSNMPAEAQIELKDAKLDDAGNVLVRTRSSDGHEGGAMIKFEGGCITEISHQS